MLTLASACGVAARAARSPSLFRWGWAAGLGAETRIGGSNWLARIEYLLYDFGNISDLKAVTNGVTATFTEGRLTTDVVRAGLSYQLN